MQRLESCAPKSTIDHISKLSRRPCAIAAKQATYMSKIKVWGPLVRIFHWALVGFFAANADFVDDDSDLHIWIGYAVAVHIPLALFVRWLLEIDRHATSRSSTRGVTPKA
jgi:hypothetical protein